MCQKKYRSTAVTGDTDYGFGLFVSTYLLVCPWANWLGVLGVNLGIFLTPGVLIFPTLYFALMFAGWFGVWLQRG